MGRPAGIVVLALLLGAAAVIVPLGLWLMPDGAALFLGGAWGALVLAAACGVAAVGLWAGRLAGWVAAVLAQGFQAAINLMRAEGAEVLVALLVPAIVVGYLLTREARRWCGVGSSGV